MNAIRSRVAAAVVIAFSGVTTSVRADAPSCLQGETGTDVIAFTRKALGQTGIWTVHSDGSDLRRVTSGTNDVGAAWSPDGSRIAFTRLAVGDYDLFVVNADGTGERNVTNTPGTDEVIPAWSPDGEWIAYHAAPVELRTRAGGVTGADFEIVATTPDGSSTRNVSRRPPAPGEIGDRAAADVKPAWSPDGSRIAFESYRGVVNSDTYNSELWWMPTDPAASADDAVQLTETLTSSEWYPAWSPDGSRIAFMRQPHGGSFEIWVMTVAPDGTVAAESKLTDNAKHDHMPSWSPDGRRIAFSSDRADGGIDVAVTGTGWNTHELGSDQLADDTWDVYVMNDDGSCATRLTALGDAHDPAFRPL